MGEEYSFLHISDLHFSMRPDLLNWLHNPFRRSDTDRSNTIRSWRQPTTYDTRRAAALARYVSRAASRADAVVITGDVASTGTPDDLQAAYSYIDRERSPSPIDGLAERGLNARKNKEKSVILPGNHDRYKFWQNIPPYWEPGDLSFDTAFNDYWQAGLNGVQRFSRGNNSALQFIAADFCLHSLADTNGSRWQALGRGFAYDTVIDRLIASTREARAENPRAIIIWCIHFCPLQAARSPLELLNSDAFLIAAEKSKVQIVLGGHMHARSLRQISNNLVLIRASTATCLDALDDSRFHVVRIAIRKQRPRLELKIFDHVFQSHNNQFAPRETTDTIHLDFEL